MGSGGEASFLDDLYDAAVNPSGWVPVMETFSDMVGGSSALLSRFSIVDGSGSSMRARSDPAMRDIYVYNYADKNPLHCVDSPEDYKRKWTPRILTDEDWMPKEDLLRTEFHNDFLRPQDIYAHLMIRLALIGDEVCVLNVQRPEKRGQFDRQGLEIAERYHHHLIRAFRLSRKLSAGRELNGNLGTLFDYSAHGLFVLDRQARVVSHNGAAEKIAKAGAGLRIIGGRLIASSTDDTKRLEGLVAAATSTDSGLRTGGSMAIKQVGKAMPLSLTIVPMRAGEFEVFRGEPAALVCVTDLDADINVPQQRLRELFGLTPAEARMAMALFEGARPAEAAAALNITANTAGVHISRIYEKTGVNRQAALIALMMRSVGLVLD